MSVSVASQVANNGLYWTAKVKATNSGATPTAALEYVSIYLPGPMAMDDPEDWFDRPQDLLKVIKGK